MTLKKYHTQLMEYRDLIDDKVVSGKMDINKAMRLSEKLAQWYDVAKFVYKLK